MDGRTLKEIAMKKSGCSFNQIADKMGISTQALVAIVNSNDVKSGHVENLIRSLGLTFNDFYPELCKEVKNAQISRNSVGVVQNIVERTQSRSIEDEPLVKYLKERNDMLLQIIIGQKLPGNTTQKTTDATPTEPSLI